MATRGVAVLDVGKSLSKISIWGVDGQCLAETWRFNKSEVGGPYSMLDVAGISGFASQALRAYGQKFALEALIPVAHGAAAALIRDGTLAASPMDYEMSLAEVDSDYDQNRSPFEQTGSPRLPLGLNLGRQLYWQKRRDPRLFDPGCGILPWPQYWAWFFSGESACELTSLGCHTDLWNPRKGDFSDLARSEGFAALFPPLRHAGAILSGIRGTLAGELGLPASMAVHCGLHDSNAALLAARKIAEARGPCGEASLLSTGTWFVAMRMTSGASSGAKPPTASDCQINVDVDGGLVPSARFMGGREIEHFVAESGCTRIDIPENQDALIRAAGKVVTENRMIMPADPASPSIARQAWPDATGHPILDGAQVALYAALMADSCLDLIGASDTLIIEGRFAQSTIFARSLAALRPHTTILTAPKANLVPMGALAVACPHIAPSYDVQPAQPIEADLCGYKALWLQRLAGR